MANQLDKFGIKMIYATKVGAREWYIRDSVQDVMNDSRTDGDLHDDLADGGSNTDGFSVKDNGQVRLKVVPESTMRDYSKTGLDQSTAKGQGFMSSSKEWDMKGLEMTARIKCTDFDTSDSRFILKGPTGSHKSNTKDCSGSSYGVRFYLAPSGSDSGTTEWFKEQWHVHYETRANSQKSTGFGSIHNRWIVVKYIIYLVQNPSNGKFEHVKMEAWMNNNNDGITWKKVNETTDTGGWSDGNGALDCGADRADEIMTWDAPSMIWRWDGPTILFKDLSMREIDPSKLASDTGTDEPTDPTSGTISREYTFRWNLVSFPIDACALGQEVTKFTKVYDVDDDGTESNLHKERYRVGVLCNGTGSDLIGKKPRRITLRLSKGGNPPSGDITCVIRNGDTDEVEVTFTWTGGTLNATALTGTKTDYVFQNLTSNYVLKAGDRIMVEYSGNTVDVINEVNVFRSTEDPFNGANTCAIKFDAGGIPPTAYSSPDIFRDYAWIIEEAGGSQT